MILSIPLTETTMIKIRSLALANIPCWVYLCDMTPKHYTIHTYTWRLKQCNHNSKRTTCRLNCTHPNSFMWNWINFALGVTTHVISCELGIHSMGYNYLYNYFHQHINTIRHEQTSRHCADDIFRRHLAFSWNLWYFCVNFIKVYSLWFNLQKGLWRYVTTPVCSILFCLFRQFSLKSMVTRLLLPCIYSLTF